MRDDMVFRPFRDADADNVLEVLKENFGAQYFYGLCYDREHLIRENREKMHLLFVAELLNGDFVGVVGAKYVRVFPGSYELSLHILRKRFQGQGLAKPLLRYCIETCEGELHANTYGHCVTYHTITQNEMAQLGMKTTAMWLGRHASKRGYLSYYGFHPRSSKLNSLVICKAGVAKNVSVLYLPAEHIDFVKAAYARLGVVCAPHAGCGGAAGGRSFLTVKNDPDAANTDIFLLSAGPDAESRIDEALSAYRQPLQSFTVLVNMRDLQCPRICAALAERGFYFTGVHPLHDGREYILYHRECEGGYDWDEMVLTAENREIADYIRSHRR